MRLHINLTKNKEVIPYNYQQLITGVIHKWLGKNNNIHGSNIKFTFSWLLNTKATKEGISLKENSSFFISAYNEVIIRKILDGLLKDPEMFYGVNVKDVVIQHTPNFESSTTFFLASPILLKVKEDNNIKHLTYKDENFEKELTNNLKRKLDFEGIDSSNLSVKLAPNTHYRSTKLVTYKGIKNRTTLAPILISGNEQQIKYAWCVGLGNSTGIGFGALK